MGNTLLRHFSYLVIIVTLSSIISPAFAYTPLSAQCELNRLGTTTIINKYVAEGDNFTTTTEIANGYSQEFTIRVDWFQYTRGTAIGVVDYYITGDNISSPWLQTYNIGVMNSNATGDQIWTAEAKYNILGCPIVDMEVQYVNVTDNKVRYQLFINHYQSLANSTFTATPTPTPPTPTPTPSPTPQSPANGTNTTANFTINTSGSTTWRTSADGYISGWNNTITNIFNGIDEPFAGMNSSINSINTSLNNITGFVNQSFLISTMPILINSIHWKVRGLVTYYLILLVILIILGRD